MEHGGECKVHHGDLKMAVSCALCTLMVLSRTFICMLMPPCSGASVLLSETTGPHSNSHPLGKLQAEKSAGSKQLQLSFSSISWKKRAYMTAVY